MSLKWWVAAFAIGAGGAMLWWQSRPEHSAAAGQDVARAGGEARRGDAPRLDRSPLDRDGHHRAEGADQGEGEGDGDGASPDTDPRWEPGEKAMGWDRWLSDFVRPQPGEGLLEYRDRMVPVAQAAIAPQRARVARSYESFADSADLDGRRRARIDALVEGTQDAIKGRMARAVFGGELFRPGGVRPMDGVRLANEILGLVVAADDELRASLTPAQLEALESSHFDLAEYLLISTRWEELVGVSGD